MIFVCTCVIFNPIANTIIEWNAEELKINLNHELCQLSLA